MMETLKEIIEAAIASIEEKKQQVLNNSSIHKYEKELESLEDYHNILNVDLLIIDDLGTEKISDSKITELVSIINTRLLNQNHKITKTIISTNLSLEDIKAIYSERVFSRISSHFSMVRLTGDDIRIQKKLLNLGGTRNVTP